MQIPPPLSTALMVMMPSDCFFLRNWIAASSFGDRLLLALLSCLLLHEPKVSETVEFKKALRGAGVFVLGKLALLDLKTSWTALGLGYLFQTIHISKVSFVNVLPNLISKA